jgi:hypothetical protein
MVEVGHQSPVAAVGAVAEILFYLDHVNERRAAGDRP